MTADERDESFVTGDVENDVPDEATISEDAIDQVMDDAAAESDGPADQLRGLVVWLVDQLMDEPESVEVTADQRGSSVQIQIRLPEEQLGKIIGRGGRVAKSIRTALMIAGTRHHLRVSLDIEGRE